MLTATVNSGAPFGSFVASRGLVALHVTAAHRLPLFDMDIVHAGHELGGGGCLGGWPRVYRVLRPGALFWLDHIFELRRRAAERDVRAPAGLC